MEEVMLRVHSADLHDHVSQEVGESLESGLYTDLMVRCKDGHTLHAHKLILSSVSPFLKSLLETNDWEDIQTLEVPEAPHEIVSLLLEVAYNGVVEATIEDLRELILLAHSLYITIPISDELMEGLDLTLPAMPPFIPKGLPKLKQRPVFPTLLNPSQTPKLTKPPMLKHPHQRTFVDKKKIVDPSALAAIMSKGLGRNSEHICPICESKYSNIGNFKQHMKMHDNDHLKDERNQLVGELVAICYDPQASLYTCHICNSNYNHSGNFKQHLLKHERESGSISAMLMAKTKEGDSFDLTEMMKSKGLQQPTPPKIHREPGAPAHTCEYCGRTFNNAGNYKQHLTSHARASLSNGLINLKSLLSMQKSPVTGSPSKRQKMSTPSLAVVKCQECHLEFPNVGDLDAHMSSSHSLVEVETHFFKDDGQDGKSFSCDLCAQTFETEVWLERHKMTFHDSDQSFSQLSDQDNSMTEFSPALVVSRKPGRPATKSSDDNLMIPAFKCKVCGKKFLTMNKLSMHIRIHNAPEDHYKFPCDVCGKRFTRLQHMNRHRLLHTGDKPYQCLNCNMAFRSEEKFRYHKADCQGDVSDGLVGWTSPVTNENGLEFDEDTEEISDPNLITSD